MIVASGAEGGATATGRASHVIRNFGTSLWFDIGGNEADGTLASIISRKIIIERLCKHPHIISFFQQSLLM